MPDNKIRSGGPQIKLSMVDRIVVNDMVIPRRQKSINATRRRKESVRINKKTDCLLAPVLLPERLENDVEIIALLRLRRPFTRMSCNGSLQGFVQ